MSRVSFVVDGFNLYHSLRDAQAISPDDSIRWLDIKSLLSSYLHLFGPTAVAEEIYYFSALARHRDVNSNGATTRKHSDYIACLRSTGVKIEMGRFKAKDVICSGCRMVMKKHEEKETDVAISVKMMELCFTDACDTLVVVSGDTDLAPPMRAVRRLFPEKRLAVILPFKRHNNELKQLSDIHVRLKADRYTKFQFSDPCDVMGRRLAKPAGW